LPSWWYEVGREDDHHHDYEEADDERQPETVQDFRDLIEEVGLLDLFLCRAPRDVVREEVCEQSLRQVDRQATEKEEAVCVPVREKLYDRR
jgi:hypothetical protein